MEIIKGLEEAKKIYPEIPIGAMRKISKMKNNPSLIKKWTPVYRTNDKNGKAQIVCKCSKCDGYRPITSDNLGNDREPKLCLCEDIIEEVESARIQGTIIGAQKYSELIKKQTIGLCFEDLTIVDIVGKKNQSNIYQAKCRHNNIYEGTIGDFKNKKISLSCGCCNTKQIQLDKIKIQQAIDLNKAFCIYKYVLNGKIIYIGLSTNLPERIKNHNQDKKDPISHIANSCDIYYFCCKTKQQMEHLEYILINKYHPEYNSKDNDFNIITDLQEPEWHQYII